jgi:hypothetical protein
MFNILVADPRARLVTRSMGAPGGARYATKVVAAASRDRARGGAVPPLKHDSLSEMCVRL